MDPVSIGEENDYDEDSMTTMFEFFQTTEDPAALLARIDAKGLVEFRLDDHGGLRRMCLSHSEAPGIVAVLK